MKTLLLTSLIPLVVGPITFLVMQNIKHASRWVDSLPPAAKRLVVMLIAVGLTALGHAAGVEIQCDPTSGINCLADLNKDAVSAIISTTVAFLMHQHRQLSKDS